MITISESINFTDLEKADKEDMQRHLAWEVADKTANRLQDIDEPVIVTPVMFMYCSIGDGTNKKYSLIAEHVIFDEDYEIDRFIHTSSIHRVEAVYGNYFEESKMLAKHTLKEHIKEFLLSTKNTVMVYPEAVYKGTYDSDCLFRNIIKVERLEKC